MDTVRIRIEIGDRKFEGEGHAKLVEGHVKTFLKLVAGLDADTQEVAPKTIEDGKGASELDSILNVADTVVWLSVKPRSASEALLVLLLGQQHLRKNTLVGGADLTRGLRYSGHKIARADHLLNAHARNKNIVVAGKHRGRRYQLTESGAIKAYEIAGRLLATVAEP